MEVIIKFVKFGVVGFSGLILDFAVTYGLKEKLGVQKYLANSIGFSIAATNNYYWNKVWTFQDPSEQIALQFSQFLIIAVVGLVLNNTLLFIFNQKLNVNFYLSKLIAIAVIILWNFTMNYLFTFSG